MLKQKALFSTLMVWIVSLLLLATGAVAQQQQTPPPSSQDNKAQTVEPERKISKEEADALFRSVDEILAFASKDTGLPIRHSVKRKLASREEVKKYIDDRMKDDEDTKRLQRSEVVLKKFALIPEQFDLRSFLGDLLKEQVAGFYDTKKKTVFLLDWVEPEAQKPVLAHELTHALQDQNFGLEKWMKTAEGSNKGKNETASDLMEDERMAAHEAVSEGQAMVVLIDYMLAANGQSVKNNPAVAEAVMASMNSSGETPLYTKAPMFLKQLLLFPYQRGLKFEADLLQKSGTEAAFAGAFREPPVDTRQIMLPETYLKKQAVPLMPVPAFQNAAGKQYERYDLSVMGEFDVWLLAKQYDSQQTADAVSPGWRGGYYYAALKPGAPKSVDGTVAVPTSAIALAYASKWASADAAGQFAAVYAKALPKRYKQVKETVSTSTPSAESSAEVRVDIAGRLNGAHTWDTEDGLVSIEVRGDTMLVVEGFDPAAAAKITDAVFNSQTASVTH
jgi:hypothetical protein